MNSSNNWNLIQDSDIGQFVVWIMGKYNFLICVLGAYNKEIE